MPNYDESIREGHYAKKQILCRDLLVSWSHGSRFDLALELVEALQPKRLLDYGCGDGTFMAIARQRLGPSFTALGVEIADDLVADCVQRLGSREGLSFMLVSSLDETAKAHSFDAIFCMEVLEHVTGLDPILDRFERLLAPNGVLVVSVPVETGLPVVVKQTVRRIAGWRGLGDYPGVTPYKIGELIRSIFARENQHITRPVHEGSAGRFHDHKGFNWMVLRRRLCERFKLQTVLGSPLKFLPPHLNSQCWFVLHKRK